MKKRRFSQFFIFKSILVLFGIFALSITSTALADDEEIISRPGKYSGYSEVLYDGYELSSQYVTVRDGTKLAVDVFRPTLDGEITDTPLPVLWMHTPYSRRYYPSSQTYHLAGNLYPGAALLLVKYGYVVAVVDQRGFYASFGTTYSGDNWDAYDITEWFADQPWCDGKVGMWGCSATGGSQISAANLMPPSLKAIFPMSCGFSHNREESLPPYFPTQPPAEAVPGDIPADDAFAVPVDEDIDESMLDAAKEEHRFNYLGRARTPISLDQLEASGVAMYNAANWVDIMPFPRDTFFRSFNLANASKTLMGPGAHCIWCTDYSPKPFPLTFDIVSEEHRFFDYWLKGIENGLMEEPPVYYFTYNAAPGEDWRFAWQWPLPNTRPTNFYLGAGPSGEGYGVNDGTLVTARPERKGADVYTTDYDIPTENITDDYGLRWITQPLAAERGLTYITPPLDTDLEVTGHPVVHLWISSTAEDGDFIVDIEDIAEDGTAESIIKASGSPSFGIIAPGRPLPDGINGIRASYRATEKPPFDNFGLPWHPNTEDSLLPLTPGEPAELAFDLRPVSHVFKAGHRIRMSITMVCGDATPRLDPAPVVNVYRNRKYPSRIVLPVVGAPIKVRVKIKPEKPGRKSSPVLSAFVTFPKNISQGYITDLDTSTVTLNGVSPLESVLHGKIWEFKFSRDNLTAVLKKGRHRLTIEGDFGASYDYGDLSFKGSASIKIKQPKHKKSHGKKKK